MSSATVEINITAVNDAPIVSDDFPSILEDTPTIINVLANDYDIDGDAFSVVNIFDVSTGTAVITSTASSIQVIPATNSLEQINFRYTATDVNGA